MGPVSSWLGSLQVTCASWEDEWLNEASTMGLGGPCTSCLKIRVARSAELHACNRNGVPTHQINAAAGHVCLQGWTMWLERKIIGRLYGEQVCECRPRQLGRQSRHQIAAHEDAAMPLLWASLPRLPSHLAAKPPTSQSPACRPVISPQASKHGVVPLSFPFPADVSVPCCDGVPGSAGGGR